MATYSKTFHKSDAATNFGLGRWNISTWYTNANYAPMQGCTTSDNTNNYGSRVGFFYLDDVGATLSGKDISSISISATYSSAGYNAAKTLVLHKATMDHAPVTADKVKGSDLVGDELGTLAVSGSNRTEDYTLNSSTNSALFSALSSYLINGGKVVTIYNGETSTTSQGYTANYLEITDLTITVTYSEPGVAYYGNNGGWVKCKMYYCLNGSWVQVVPYYGLNGAWVKV